MRFDVIVSNPPFQNNVGNKGRNSGYSVSIWHKFVDLKYDLDIEKGVFINPSRWMTNTAEGVSSEWVSRMLDGEIRVMVDYEDSSDIFKGVSISGGVHYYLIDSSRVNGFKCDYSLVSYDGKVTEEKLMMNEHKSDMFIRDLTGRKIVRKIVEVEGRYFDEERNNFSRFVYSGGYGRGLKTSYIPSDIKSNYNSVKIYVTKRIKSSGYGYTSRNDIFNGLDLINSYRILTPRAYGSSSSEKVIGDIIISEPFSVASNSYLTLYFGDLEYHDIIKVKNRMRSKLFRFLVKIAKSTQGVTKRTFSYVPICFFSMNEDDVIEKYGLTEEEVEYVYKSVS